MLSRNVLRAGNAARQQAVRSASYQTSKTSFLLNWYV